MLSSCEQNRTANVRAKAEFNFTPLCSVAQFDTIPPGSSGGYGSAEVQPERPAPWWLKNQLKPREI